MRYSVDAPVWFLSQFDSVLYFLFLSSHSTLEDGGFYFHHDPYWLGTATHGCYMVLPALVSGKEQSDS